MSARTRPARPDLARMLVLLEQEKHALTQGDMPGLIRLAPRKEAVLARLDTATPALNGGDGALAQQVQRDAARNAR